jgi:hypothetical protein
VTALPPRARPGSPTARRGRTAARPVSTTRRKPKSSGCAASACPAGHRAPGAAAGLDRGRRAATAGARPFGGARAEAAGHPLPAREPRRADPPRYQKAGPHRRHRSSHHRPPLRHGQEPGYRLGSPARRRRRREPARLHRAPCRRPQGERDGLPTTSPRVLLGPWGHGRTHHDRQRQCLSLARFRRRDPRRRPAPPPHPTLYTAHQRQSRTLHPVQPPRMGLRPTFPILRRAQHRPAVLERPLQSQPTPLSPRRPPTH